MRIVDRGRKHFRGTHKGCEIEIEREPADAPGAFYIIVRGSSGNYLYDGWSPAGVLTMAEAKREALYGSTLKARPLNHTERDPNDQ